MASSVAFAAEEKKPQSSSSDASAASDSARPELINPKDFSTVYVVGNLSINDNTHLLLLSAPNNPKPLNMPAASFVLVRVRVGDKEEIRPYTPIASDPETGAIILMVKDYPQGIVSKHIAGLSENSTIEVKGPIAKIAVNDGMKKDVALIAGGSGITPMFQVMSKLAESDAHKTKVTLVYANVEEKDIWLKDAFDAMAAHVPGFKTVYFLEQPPAGWKGETGRVTKDALQKVLPPPSNDTLIMVCGPPGMMKAVSGEKTKDYKQGEVEGILKELGYTSDQVFKF